MYQYDISTEKEISSPAAKDSSERVIRCLPSTSSIFSQPFAVWKFSNVIPSGKVNVTSPRNSDSVSSFNSIFPGSKLIKKVKIVLKLLISVFLFISIGVASEIKVFEFTEAELSQLEVRKVRGADNKTNYSVGSNENGNFLKSVADNAASGLGKEVKIDLNKTPFINITWKVEKDLSGIKENTKKGHDFAARVFAVKKTGATPLSNRAINYVFSSNNEIGFSSPSPYTKKSIDNVLSTTKNNLNQWVTVKANVKEDFKKFHDLDVNELDGLAIMSDTDNSKMKAIAYFQNIYFSAN